MMLEPILVSEYGEKIDGYPDGRGGTDDTDESKLSGCIGVHQICRGFVDIEPISETHKAVACRKCNMRIVIPNDVNTFGDLRKHFAWLRGKIKTKQT